VLRSLELAKSKGHRLVLLVGDEPYYGPLGFRPVKKGDVKMPGPVDPARLLVAELVDGAAAGIKGAVQPDWDFAGSSLP
jgi:predicted N-acetyltransferase YhbS